jgi:hypothetical protein
MSFLLLSSGNYLPALDPRAQHQQSLIFRDFAVADCIPICFELDNPESLKRLTHWYRK